MDDLPDWLPAWCLYHLGREPAGVLFQVHQVSIVFGLRLAGALPELAQVSHYIRGMAGRRSLDSHAGARRWPGGGVRLLVP